MWALWGAPFRDIKGACNSSIIALRRSKFKPGSDLYAAECLKKIEKEGQRASFITE